MESSSMLMLLLLYMMVMAEGLSRTDFPKGFVFGSASAAFQYEGAVKEGGRGPSIWDTFSHTPVIGNILDGQNADVSTDQYHHYEKDIKLMADIGMDAYRFSISWSRIFPSGRGEVNSDGIAYYNNLINKLLEDGIEPYVTLYHWDLPQALQDSYQGWLSPLIVDDFAAYAKTCFQAFGDRVKYWITINEPTSFILEGYDTGFSAPGRCSPWMANCSAGNSSIEPYVAAHHVLLSHAAAVEVYRKLYQDKQRGFIGISLSAQWYTPLTNSSTDATATQRAFDFQQGWFLDPLMFGDYPASMKQLVGSRLPTFTKEERSILCRSLDFIGINHYTSMYVSDSSSQPAPEHREFYHDMLVNFSAERDGVLIGPRAASSWLYIVPSGIYNMVKYIQAKYDDPAIIITESGVDESNNSSLSLKEALHDTTRIKFYHDYLSQLAVAVREGADVRAFFAWSLLDGFEWSWGYSYRYGLCFVDFKTLKRYPKASAYWFRSSLRREEQKAVAHSILKTATIHLGMNY